MRLALVGPDQQENLALGYLAAAAEAAGHEAALVPYNTGRDLDRSVSAVLALSPALVGVGIPFQHAVGEVLDLCRALRRRGYRGHLTCGGHVPTFCSEEILRDCPEMDTVVRHEGEDTLVELLGRLEAGGPVRDLAGLVWREGGRAVPGPTRPLRRDLDALAPPRPPDPPMSVGGVQIAFLLTGRGCEGDCAYCSIRAFGRDAGGPALRLREPEAVAEEVARRARLGARVFFVQDDLFVLPSEARTLDRMAAIDRAVRALGVRKPLLWIKGRPDSITPAVVRAARDMGAVHLFLGVESASPRTLRALGRRHTPDDDRRALALCREGRVRPSFNLMLFEPDSALEDVALSVDLAAETLALPWNVCRTEVYSGTRLLDRLAAEGRLRGDYRSYGYLIADPAAEVVFRVMRVAFHERAFAFDSLHNKLISLSFARQVHEELLQGAVTADLSRQVDELLVEVHRDSVDEMRRLLDLAPALDLGDRDRVRDLAVETAFRMGGRALGWHERFDRLWATLNARGAAVLGSRR